MWVIYRHIGDWKKEKIGIGKCKNIHIGVTLPASVRVKRGCTIIYMMLKRLAAYIYPEMKV